MLLLFKCKKITNVCHCFQFCICIQVFFYRTRFYELSLQWFIVKIWLWKFCKQFTFDLPRPFQKKYIKKSIKRGDTFQKQHFHFNNYLEEVHLTNLKLANPYGVNNIPDVINYSFLLPIPSLLQKGIFEMSFIVTDLYLKT